MAKSRQDSLNRRATYHRPLNDEKEEEILDHIFVGRRSTELEIDSKKKYGDIGFWLADRQRRESAKRGPLHDKRSSNSNSKPIKMVVKETVNSRNTQILDKRNNTASNSFKARNQTEKRRFLSHVEIIVPSTKKFSSCMLTAQSSVQLLTPLSSALSVSSAMGDPSPRRSGRATRKHVKYADLQPRETSPPESSASSVFEGQEPSESEVTMDLNMQETASSSYPSDVDFDEPPFKKRKISRPKATSLSTSRTKSKAADTDIEVLDDNASIAGTTSDDRDYSIDENDSMLHLENLTNKSKVSGIHLGLRPLSNITEIMTDLTKRAIERVRPSADPNNTFKDTKTALPKGTPRPNLETFLNALGSRPLRVATMCSGTESPLLALDMIRDAMKELLPDRDDIRVVHVFSAEIEPFKQAYIERNFHPPLIFRDITEITDSKDGRATTAYGGKFLIPGNVDLVIAGTSCVDFSNLNGQRKVIGDAGESTHTFRAVLEYAKRNRPPILILENVYSAPWAKLLHQYREIDYAVARVLVDSKDYYLPQTRQRGYMICYDATKINQVNQKAVLQQTCEVMRELRRPVSSPISCFLLNNDDEDVIRSRQTLARRAQLDSSIRDNDWAKCEFRHIKYRRDNLLGTQRPLTGWQECGTLVLPEYCDKQWFRSQVERVRDVADMSLLRKALPRSEKVKTKMISEGKSTEEPYDVQFKTRIWNLSQNIDRFTDTAHFGISSCLTPSGLFYITDRGGPLTYKESLMIQGLPLERISFTTESERNIQDMAGNAMSTTVVGAAILSSLIAGHELFSHEPSQDDPMVVDEVDAASVSEPHDTHVRADELTLIEPSSSSMSLDDVDWHQLCRDAERSAKKCCCEGQIEVTERHLQICVDCGHTACTYCGVKPTHNYQPLEHDQRDRPEAFIQKWQSLVPMVVKFEETSLVEGLVKSKPRSPLIDVFIDAVIDAVNHPLTFKHFRRSTLWTITYESPFAKLDLEVGGESCEWRLFIKPDKDLPGNDPLRLFAKQSIAKACVTDQGLSSWSWRVPYEKVNFELTIQGQGEMVPSWFTKLGLIAHKDEKTMYPELKIVSQHDQHMLSENVSGTYSFLPDCGTACSSLYKRVQPHDASAMYLFLDPDRIGDTATDSFCFSTNPSRLEYDQSREVVAKIEPKSLWRPWNLPQSSTAQGLANGVWVVDTDLSLAVSPAVQSVRVAQDALINSDCSEPKHLVSLEFETPYTVEKRFVGEKLVQSDDKAFFSAFGWAMKDLRGAAVSDNDGVLTNLQAAQCPSSCAPVFPKTRWRLVNKTVRAIEDPQSATNYEIALKRRPQPFVIRSQITEKSVKVDIGINILSLCQRAAGKLIRRTNNVLDNVHWTLDTNWADNATEVSPSFTLRDNSKDAACSVSPLKEKLFRKQQKSLTWMLLQEAQDVEPFVLEEVEESMMSHIGYRLEARATASLRVKGGILADHAGFGKTITSLALIKSEFDEKRSAQNIIGSMVDLEMSEAKHALPEKIAATLIICPADLVDQWTAEVKNMVGKNWEPLTIRIKTTGSFYNYTAADFRKARIIIVSSGAVYTETYLQYLANFAGVPMCMWKGPREFKSWLEHTVQYVPDHHQLRSKMKKKDFGDILQKAYTEHLKNDGMLLSFVAFSKRLKGKNYQASKEKAEDSELTQSEIEAILNEPPTIDERVYGGVLLEMFHFNRIIVDEISYSDLNDIIAYSSLKADKRWGLSATPSLKDTFDVSQLARLLGLDLPIGASAQGMVSATNIERSRRHMTRLEEFETYREAPSRVMQSKIHGLAQKFLDKFVRQNNQSFEDFPYSDLVLPTRMNADQHIVYADLSVRLNSSEMRLRKATKKAKRSKKDRDADEDEIVSKACGLFSAVEAESAEEALVKTAALLDNSVSDGLQTVDQSCKATRVKEKAKLEATVNAAHVIATKNKNKKHDCNNCELKEWTRTIVANGLLGDLLIEAELIEMIEKICPGGKFDMSSNAQSYVEIKPLGTAAKVAGKKRKHDDQEAHVASIKREEELRGRYSEFNEAVKDYRVSARSCRIVDNACQYDRTRAGKQFSVVCNRQGPNCSARYGTSMNANDAAHLKLSVVCGHVVCNECLEVCNVEDLGRCKAQGCSHESKPFHFLNLSDLGRNVKCHDGQKAQDLVKLLTIIQTRGDQAILFVQYDEQLTRLSNILQQADIRHLYKGTSTKFIQEYEDSAKRPTNKKVTVIILNSSDVSAAGKNFQFANHVIFFSPLLLGTQHDYQAQMAQGIGRVRRHGQKKNIFVYRMTALHTIDVDILEQRELQKGILYPYKFSDDFEDIDARMEKEKKDNEHVALGRTQLILDPEDQNIKLVPMNMLVKDERDLAGVRRIEGYGNFGSVIKFSKTFGEDD